MSQRYGASVADGRARKASKTWDRRSLLRPPRLKRPRALLITGTAGSGKTAVALDIGCLLPNRGLAVAVILGEMKERRRTLGRKVMKS